MSKQSLTTLLVSVLLFVSCGCAQKTTVVLLSDPDGQVGHLIVTNDAGSVTMNQPAQATHVTGRQSSPGKPETLTEQQIADQFSVVLATVPNQPEHFLLYFQKGATTLTAESEAVLPRILQSISEKNSRAISVIGHSDTDGDRDFNLLLSRERAQAVSAILTRQGVKPENIICTSHGEENPLVKTADNVSEPKNRRVEVVIK